MKTSLGTYPLGHWQRRGLATPRRKTNKELLLKQKIKTMMNQIHIDG
jgi:hypothetical protein